MRRLICQRVCAVEGVAARCAVRVSGGRYNIYPDCRLSNRFITIKLLFYDNIFHHAAESLFIGTAAGDVIGEFFDKVGASVPAESFTDLTDNVENISISTGKLHGDVLVSAIILPSRFYRAIRCPRSYDCRSGVLQARHPPLSDSQGADALLQDIYGTMPAC